MAESKVASEEQLKRGEEILERFYNEILAPRVTEFKPLVEHLRDADIREFGGIVGAFIQKTLSNLCQMLDMPLDGDFNAICPGLGDYVSFYIIGEFNKTLPLDFPYLAALLKIPENSRHKLTFIVRKLIPGAHDMMSSHIVPIIDNEIGVNGFFSSITELADFIRKRKKEQGEN